MRLDSSKLPAEGLKDGVIKLCKAMSSIIGFPYSGGPVQGIALSQKPVLKANKQKRKNFPKIRLNKTELVKPHKT